MRLEPRIISVKVFRPPESSYRTYYYTPFLVFKFTGLIPSESKPGVVYTTSVTIRVRPKRYSLLRYTCECEAYVFKAYICKHVRKLYNKSLDIIRQTLRGYKWRELWRELLI